MAKPSDEVPRCVNHPDTEGTLYCAKYKRYYCGECLRCSDPELYCKFRKMCVIWEYVKYGEGGLD